MAKSKLSEDQWAALFAEEAAGVTRRDLCARYGLSKSAIGCRAQRLGLLKRDTGATDHRQRPPGGWPDDQPLPQSRAGLSPAAWRALFRRWHAGEDVEALAAEAGVSFGGFHAAASRMALRKKDAPGAVGNYRGGERFRPAAPAADQPPFDPGVVLHEHQQPPESPWTTWLLLGGRGAGKTLAGAVWLARQAMALGDGGRLALIGPTLHDVREVMIEGVSGLRALPCWTPETRPVYEPSRRRLIFAGGCVAQVFSAEDPDSLRGPQFSGAWADEFCAWPALGARGAAETLALLRMGLRLPGPRAQAASDRLAGDSAPPRLVITTTPRPTRALIALRAEPGCESTTAATRLNAMNLTPGFLEGLAGLYGGTRREAQELEGRIVDLDGALFTADTIRRAREPDPTFPSPLVGGGRRPTGGPRSGSDEGRPTRSDGPLGMPWETLVAGLDDPTPSRAQAASRRAASDSAQHVIVSIDPTTTVTGDACGIVAAARLHPAEGGPPVVHVLADRSRAGLTPLQWARRALDLAAEVGAAALVAEVNQGGDMVRQTLAAAGCALPVIEVRATRGKRVRAEPVAALYEQGRVRHRPLDGRPLDALEDELLAFGAPEERTASLDRADALVWAVTHLLIDGGGAGGLGPRMRWLDW